VRRPTGHADRATLAAYAPTVELSLGADARLLAYHGSPRSFDDPISATTSPDTLDTWFAGTDADVYAGGHTHQPFARRHRQAFVINPGSVGLAFAQDAVGEGRRNRPWAEYAIAEYRGGGISIELRRLPYDGAQVVASARARGMPYADWWGRDLLA
jgi:predicted phosphodiesterase